jgi:GH3 auxin-responsive promoter
VGYRRFKKSLTQTEKIQREKLTNILQSVAGTELGEQYSIQGDMTWESFAQEVPVTSYTDCSPLIEKQRAGAKNCLIHSPCQRYQPTSGSTSQVKWIPYTDSFLKELDSAISP